MNDEINRQNQLNKEKIINDLLKSSQNNKSDDYQNYITKKLNEKKYVASDFASSNKLDKFIWPSVFYQSQNQNEEKEYISYLKLISFYALPLGVTVLFSSLIYPKTIYLIKKIFGLKKFWTINLAALPILLFFNIRVYCLLQTYIGFKYIQNNYSRIKKKPDGYGRMYSRYVKLNNIN